MRQGDFYTPKEIEPLYDEIVPIYQIAFEDWPWKEVSKCPDSRLRCVGGLSSISVGALCEVCEICPTRPAYEAAELVERFKALATSRSMTWYIERDEVGLTMAAVAWRAKTNQIAKEKYSDVNDMQSWMATELGNEEIMWLDEVFADKQRKPKGNLQNFGQFVEGLADRLNSRLIAYRTIEPRMTLVAKRDFGDQASLFMGDFDRRQDIGFVEYIDKVPDRRDFVIINLGKEQ